MFYDKFTELCERTGQKPTPVLKQLGLSAGNLQKWRGGAVVNADIVRKVASHFEVSPEFLLEIEQPATPEREQPVLSEHQLLIKQVSERAADKSVGALKAIIAMMDQIENQ